MDDRSRSGLADGRRAALRARQAARGARCRPGRPGGPAGGRQAHRPRAGDLSELSPVALRGGDRQLALDEAEAARRLADEELELARAFAAPRALGVALRAAGVARGGRAGEALIREALDTLEQADARLERARALTDLGALVRRGNRRREARELLREALDIAHRAGAGPLAARAETELRATGARPRRVVLAGVESLTASERRVAELAGRRAHQPRDRTIAVCHRTHRRGAPDQRVPQARPGVARSAPGRDRARRQPLP